MNDTYDIAVLIPCYNESLTIGEVVRNFRRALPTARIYVYDNNSRDDTAMRAALAGATVFRERRQGKGNVVRRMFADIDADIYLMADGDGTYAPEDAEGLINALITERADMVVGTRRDVTIDAGRQGHAFGNMVFNRLYRSIFGGEFTDIFSGYRAFSRRFVKSFPAISNGFEIETEMSVHASRLKLPVCELSLDYGRRPEGSHSKLSTFGDGRRILWMFAMLMKETRPFAFFSILAWALFCCAIGFSIPVFYEFFTTGMVTRMPTWILTVTMVGMSFGMFMAGLILDSLARSRTELLRIHYMDLPALSATRAHSQATQPVALEAAKPARVANRRTKAA